MGGLVRNCRQVGLGKAPSKSQGKQHNGAGLCLSCSLAWVMGVPTSLNKLSHQREDQNSETARDLYLSTFADYNRLLLEPLLPVRACPCAWIFSPFHRRRCCVTCDDCERETSKRIRGIGLFAWAWQLPGCFRLRSKRWPWMPLLVLSCRMGVCEPCHQVLLPSVTV